MLDFFINCKESNVNKHASIVTDPFLNFQCNSPNRTFPTLICILISATSGLQATQPRKTPSSPHYGRQVVVNVYIAELGDCKSLIDIIHYIGQKMYNSASSASFSVTLAIFVCTGIGHVGHYFLKAHLSVLYKYQVQKFDKIPSIIGR